jgi:hypothetical protein
MLTTAELAANWNRTRESHPWAPTRPGTQFRLPTAAAIKAMLAAKEVPEDKIKNAGRRRSDHRTAAGAARARVHPRVARA